MIGDDFRFLTVCAKDQPDFEIILMEPKAGMLMDEESARQFRALIDKGIMGAGAFHTDDCHATYAELKAKALNSFQNPRKDLTALKPCSKTIPETGSVSRNQMKRTRDSL